MLLWKAINDNIAAKSQNSFRCRTKSANCGDANVEGKFDKRHTDWSYVVDNFQFIFLRLSQCMQYFSSGALSFFFNIQIFLKLRSKNSLHANLSERRNTRCRLIVIINFWLSQGKKMQKFARSPDKKPSGFRLHTTTFDKLTIFVFHVLHAGNIGFSYCNVTINQPIRTCVSITPSFDSVLTHCGI